MRCLALIPGPDCILKDNAYIYILYPYWDFKTTKSVRIASFGLEYYRIPKHGTWSRLFADGDWAEKDLARPTEMIC